MTPVFVHGWGVDATIWDGVRARLDDPGIALDLGYGGAPMLAMPARRMVGVGHSFGLLWLLRAVRPGLAGLISISGFACFRAAAGWPQGMAPRVLARMRAAQAADPGAVLDTFRARCGLPAWVGARDDARLAADLAELADADQRPGWRDLPVPRVCLAASDDPIVQSELSEATAALAGGVCRFSREGGHMLPLTRPDWCAEQIAAFLMDACRADA